jgi:hypothetical protein
VFGPVTDADFDALTSGVGLGYAVVSFRGKVWRVRHSNEEVVLRDDKGHPLRRLRCVIIGSNPALSKTFYEGAYEPGSTNPPDCSSIDGVTPDIGVANPQSLACATCHNNQFGSKILDNGKKAKACTDSRRLALLPYPDLANETFGGPMMLRVPPASLESLAKAINTLRTSMIPPHAAVIDIAFEIDAEYPMLTFTPRAVISDPAMAALIMEARNGSLARQILHGAQAPVVGDALRLPAATRPAALPSAAAAPAPAKPAKTTKAAPKAAKTAPPPADDDDDLNVGTSPTAAAPAPADDDDLVTVAAAKPTARRVEAQPAAPTVDPLDDDDDSVLGDILAGLD